MSARIGFVGLGVMGGPMAGHLIRAGHSVTVWNRSAEKSAPFRETAQVADSLAQLAEVCTVIFICVSRTEDVAECLEAMAGAAPGTLFVDHSTISPKGAEDLYQKLADRGHRLVDAPITGGSMGAQNGQLTVFCGGTVEDVAEAMPYIQAYSKRADRMGGPGKGQMTKMVNQIAVGGALLALCEAMGFAEKAGLDLVHTHDIIASGAGGSWAFENYGKKILARDWSPGFSIENQRKDFGYCREAAEETGAMIPGTNLVDSLLEVLDRQGHGGWTTAALYDLMTGHLD